VQDTASLHVCQPAQELLLGSVDMRVALSVVILLLAIQQLV
jgi:hypothetical protein